MARHALRTDSIPLTHEVLGQLLAVRRASVTDCIDVLEQNGLVRRKRGEIVLVNTAALEESCCECFKVIQKEYVRQMKSFAGAAHDEPDSAGVAISRPTEARLLSVLGRGGEHQDHLSPK